MIHSFIGSLSGRCRINWAQASSTHVSQANKINRKFAFYIILDEDEPWHNGKVACIVGHRFKSWKVNSLSTCIFNHLFLYAFLHIQIIRASAILYLFVLHFYPSEFSLCLAWTILHTFGRTIYSLPLLHEG